MNGRQVFSLAYVLDLSEKNALLGSEQRRDIEVHAPQQRARLLRGDIVVDTEPVQFTRVKPGQSLIGK